MLDQILPNFRRIAGTRLFRSSNPNVAAMDTISAFERLNIQTIIDLRVPVEASAETGELLDHFYTPYVLQRNGKLGAVNIAQDAEPFEKLKIRRKSRASFTISEEDDEDEAGEVPVEEPSRPYNMGRHIYYSLLEEMYLTKVRTECTFLQRLLFYILFLLDYIFGTSYEYKLMWRVLKEPLNFNATYQNILNNCGRNIRHALMVLCEPFNVPAVVNCSYGKDRTGLFSMLVQVACGVERRTICMDYAKSKDHLTALNERISHEVRSRRLSLTFNFSKYESMQAILDYLDERYGSPVAYLDSIGFGIAERNRLKNNVRATSARPSAS